mmetsp:Transcript_22335/g.32984  ORF Transcript_22335/g.32984 Transcript_22335/m.32984 type:complete len:445 (-) Transcript_22335:20-1354(-)
MVPSSIKRRRALMNPSIWTNNSMLLVVSTALLTWIIATLYHHSYFQHDKHADELSKHPLKRQQQQQNLIRWKTKTTEHKSNGNLNENEQVSKETIGAAMQGGKSFKKVSRSYINMTNYDGPSTVWKKQNRPKWCVSLPKSEIPHLVTTPAHEGMLFQRPVKTGTTTLTAVILRMVERYAASSSERCQYRAMHETSRKLEFGKRNPTNSFLWSIVRDPTNKAISRYFHFDISIGQKEPTDKHFMEIMQRVYNRNDLAQQLVLTDSYKLQDASSTSQVVQEILDGYNFIAVTERMDESLVVFMYLLDLDLYDILYIKARASGSFTNGPVEKGRACIYITPSFLTPTMSDFFESEEWKSSNAIDISLYKAIYKSLDNTITTIPEFQQKLNDFQELQKIADQFCQDKVISWCTDGGSFIPKEERTCVLWAEGCDFDCLTEFRKQHENH